MPGRGAWKAGLGATGAILGTLLWLPWVLAGLGDGSEESPLAPLRFAAAIAGALLAPYAPLVIGLAAAARFLPPPLASGHSTGAWGIATGSTSFGMMFVAWLTPLNSRPVLTAVLALSAAGLLFVLVLWPFAARARAGTAS